MHTCVCGLVDFEKHLEDGYDEGKRKEREYGREDIEYYIERQIFLVWRYKTAQYGDEIFHVDAGFTIRR